MIAIPTLPALTGRWVPPDTRDAIVDFVRTWSDKTEIAAARFIEWIGIARGKFSSTLARNDPGLLARNDPACCSGSRS